MTNIDAYRRGYERGLDELAKVREEELADIPEKVVKGLFSLPFRAIGDIFLSNDDEERGFQDAINGREFDP